MKMKRALSGLLIASMLSGILPTDMLSGILPADTVLAADASTVDVMGQLFPQSENEDYIDRDAVADDLPYHNGTELLTVDEPFYMGLTSDVADDDSVTRTGASGIYGNGGTLMEDISSANGYQLDTYTPNLRFADAVEVGGKSYSLELLSILSSYEGDFDGDGTDEIAMIVGARTKGTAGNHYDMLVLCTTDAEAPGLLTPVYVLFEGKTLGDGTRFLNPEDWISKALVVCGDFDGDAVDEIASIAPMNRGNYGYPASSAIDIADDGFYDTSGVCLWDMNNGKWNTDVTSFDLAPSAGGVRGRVGALYCAYSMAVGDIDNDGYDDIVTGETMGDNHYAIGVRYGAKTLSDMKIEYTDISGWIRYFLGSYHVDVDKKAAAVWLMDSVGVAVTEAVGSQKPTIFVTFKNKTEYWHDAFYGIIAIDDVAKKTIPTCTYVAYGAISPDKKDPNLATTHAAMSIATTGYDFGLAELNNQIDSGSIIVDGLVFSYQKALDDTGYNYNVTYKTRLTDPLDESYGDTIYISSDTPDGYPTSTAINSEGISYYNTRGGTVNGESDGFIFQYKQNGTTYVKYYDSKGSSGGFTEIFSQSFTDPVQTGDATQTEETEQTEVTAAQSVVTAMPNVDQDSIYLKYNDHYFFWSDPVILAALVSPPYFDCLPSDNYTNGETAYGTFISTETGTTQTLTTSVGPYISTETGGGGLGTTAIFEQESEYMSHSSKELEETKTYTFSVVYRSKGGEHNVVLSTAAFDAYNYTAYYPSEDGSLLTSPYTVVVPRGGEAAMLTTTVKYDDYLSLIPYAEGALPTLEDVFPTLGKPATYPATTSRPNSVAGSVVSFGSNRSFPTGTGSVEQTIEASNDSTVVNTSGKSVSVKLGGGISASAEFLDGLLNCTSKAIGGVITENDVEKGMIVVNSSGASYSGVVCGQDDGINASGDPSNQRAAFNWEMFKYNYRSVTTENGVEYVHEFPVVTYKLEGVQQPAGVIPDSVTATPLATSLPQVGHQTPGSSSSVNVRIKATGIARRSNVYLVDAPEGMTIDKHMDEEDSQLTIYIDRKVDAGNYTIKVAVGGVESEPFNLEVTPYEGANDIPLDIENVDFGSVKQSDDGLHCPEEQVVTIVNTLEDTDALELTATIDEGEFEITKAISSDIIPKGGTGTLSVKPKAGLAPGVYRGSLKLEEKYGALKYVGLIYEVLEPTVPGPIYVYDREEFPLTASWYEPDDTGGPAITDYELTIEGETLNEDGSQKWISTGGSTWYTIRNEEYKNKTYRIGVRAVNRLGTGKESWFTWTAVTYTPPSEVQNVKVYPGDGQITVTWDPPAEYGGVGSDGSVLTSPINYLIGADDMADEWSSYYSVPRNACDHTITGLTNGVEYKIGIIASHSTSSIYYVNATPEAGKVIAPSRPTNLAAKLTYGQAELTWEEPEYNGGSAITGYQVSSDGGVTWTETLPATTKTYTVTGLELGKEYAVLVRALNSAGEGGTASIDVVGVSKLETPDIFTAASGYEQVELMWEIPTGEGKHPDGYEIKINNGEWTSIEPLTFDGRYVYAVTGLENDAYCEISLRGYNSEGGGPAYTGNFYPASSYPAPVSNLRAVPRNGRVEIYFDAPKTPEGESYDTRVLKSNGWWLISSGEVFTGLTNGETYTYAIGIDTGSGIRSIRYVSATPSADIPDPPDEPVVTSVAQNKTITINWEAPADNGSEILYYVIDESMFMEDYGRSIVLSPDTTSYTLDYATEGEYHKADLIFVTAVNAVGETSAWVQPANYRLDKSADIVLPVDYEGVDVKYDLITRTYYIGNEEINQYWYSDSTEDDGCWKLTSDYSEITLNFRTLSIAPGLAAGVYPVTVTWTKNGASTAFNINVTVSESADYSIKDMTLPAAFIGDNYYPNGFTTNFGDATWSIASGALPDGLSIDANGLIYGTPTKKGTYTFTVQATNGAGTATKEFTINVYVRGDVSGDDVFDKADVTALMKHISGALILDNPQEDVMDYNYDGKVDILDVTYMLYDCEYQG